MTTHRTLSDLEISQSGDELVIRGRRMAVVVSVIGVFLLVSFSLVIAFKNIFGTAQQAAIWDRPAGDRIFVLVFILGMVLPFAVFPIVMFIVHLRKRRRAWVFSRQRRQLTRLHQCWSLS